MIILNLYCNEERRFTAHSVIEENDIQKITCLACLHPMERDEKMIRGIDNIINIKKEIWDEFKRLGMPDLREPELVIVEDQGEEHQQHHEETKRKLKEICKKMLRHWKAILTISVAFLLILKFIFQVI